MNDIGQCNQCDAEAIDYCIECDNNLCSDCRMKDPDTDETLCEACLTYQEKANIAAQIQQDAKAMKKGQ